MECQAAKLLIAPYVLTDTSLTADEESELEAHLSVCPTCEEEMFKTARVIGILRATPAAQICRTPQTDVAFLPLIPKPRRRRLVRVLASALALAACITLCFTGGLDRLGSMLGRPRPAVVSTDQKQTEPMGFASLLNGSRQVASRIIRAGEVLTTSDHQQLQIRIWDRHVITMEAGTRLVLDGNPNAGCRVHLDQGRIEVSVTRAVNEGRFKVETAHACMTVMGTVFVVEAAPDKSHLMVKQGVVNMSARSGEIQAVSAGQHYQSDGRQLVRMDEPVNHHEIRMLSRIAADAQDEIASLCNSPWYQERFAPLLRLKDYLQSRGKSANELTLVAVSSDLWAIQRSKSAGEKPLFLHRKSGLERAARYYGYQVQWIEVSSPEQVENSANQIATVDDLLLVYNVDGGKVINADGEAIKRGVLKSIQPYRFLGEEESKYVAARISPATTRISRNALAGEALRDIHELLLHTTDREYSVGQAALADWADTVTEQAGITTWANPMLMDLRMIAACKDTYLSLGMPIDAMHWRFLSEKIRFELESLHASTESNAGLCDAERKQKKREHAAGLIEAIRNIGRQVSE